jgi:hypothetical protein
VWCHMESTKALFRWPDVACFAYATAARIKGQVCVAAVLGGVHGPGCSGTKRWWTSGRVVN